MRAEKGAENVADLQRDRRQLAFHHIAFDDPHRIDRAADRRDKRPYLQPEAVSSIMEAGGAITKTEPMPASIEPPNTTPKAMKKSSKPWRRKNPSYSITSLQIGREARPLPLLIVWACRGANMIN